MKNRKIIFIFEMLPILIVVFSVLNRDFFSISNFMTILRQSSILLVLSLGLTGVVLTGNIDLSVGSVVALTGCICAKMLITNIPVPLAIIASLGIGIFTGICNGWLVGMWKLPSFVATYGMNMVVMGFATIVMNGGIIYGLPEGFTYLGIGELFGIPFSIWIAGVLFVFCRFLFQHTTFGRNIYMIGHNMLVAEYSGIQCVKNLMLTYLLCGLTGSIGGIMLTARLNAADAGMSETYGLQIVTAVVVGGTSLLGGEGGVTGTVFGSIILTMIVNIMNMNGVNSNWQNFVLGMIILLLVWIDSKFSFNKKEGTL